MKQIIAWACLPVLLAACGPNIQGTYKDASGRLELTLDGQYAQYLGLPKMTYRVDDGQLRLDHPQAGALRFRVQDDRTITSPITGALTKQ